MKDPKFFISGHWIHFEKVISLDRSIKYDFVEGTTFTGNIRRKINGIRLKFTLEVILDTGSDKSEYHSLVNYPGEATFYPDSNNPNDYYKVYLDAPKEKSEALYDVVTINMTVSNLLPVVPDYSWDVTVQRLMEV